MKHTSPHKRKVNLKPLWQLLYIFGTLVIIYFMGFADPEFRELEDRLSMAHPFWLCMCMAGMLGFWLIQGSVLMFLSRVTGERVPYLPSLRITMIGEYYSAITPFSTGGQPMQIAYYKRYKVGVARSTAILAIRLIGYTVSLCLFYVVIMACKGGYLYREHNGLFWCTTVGFLMNFGAVVLLVAVLINRGFVERLCRWVVWLICRLPFLRKKEEKWLEKLRKGVDDFAEAGKYLKRPRQVLILLLLSLLSLLSEFSVCYFVYRSLGLTEYGWFHLFSMQVALYLGVAFIPTPGAIGASEGGFYLFFAGIFPDPLLYVAMILWRLFTYYSNLIVGAGLVIWDEVGAMARRKHKSAEESTPSE